MFKNRRFDVLEALDKGFKSKFQSAAWTRALTQLLTGCRAFESKFGVIASIVFSRNCFWAAH